MSWAMFWQCAESLFPNLADLISAWYEDRESAPRAEHSRSDEALHGAHMIIIYDEHELSHLEWIIRSLQQRRV